MGNLSRQMQLTALLALLPPVPLSSFAAAIQGSARSPPQHGRMHLEADLSRDAGALDQLAKASDCERCTPL